MAAKKKRNESKESGSKESKVKNRKGVKLGGKKSSKK